MSIDIVTTKKQKPSPHPLFAVVSPAQIPRQYRMIKKMDWYVLTVLTYGVVVTHGC